MVVNVNETANVNVPRGIPVKIVKFPEKGKAETCHLSNVENENKNIENPKQIW